ncbi:MAG: restriction endonuclease subunit S [Synechococcaceae cyanobacterium ELA445]
MAGSESTIGALLDETGGSIKTGPFGTKLKASEYTATGVPVISVGEVGFGRLRVHHDTPRVDDTVSSRMPEYLLKAGDIVFGRKGAVERSAQVQPDEDGYFLGSDGIRIRLNVEECDPKFISYQLQTTAHRSWMIQHAAGTTMPSLNEGIIRRIPIVLKPLAEQKAIAAVLGALDDKIELNRRMNAKLEEMARALFQSWFVDFDPVRAKLDGRQPVGLDPGTAALFPEHLEDSPLGHIPKGWEVRTIESLCDVITSGGTPARMHMAYWEPGTIPWFKTGELLDGPLIDAEEKISKEGLTKSACKLWPAGTILFALYASPTVGRFGVLTKPSTANQAAAALIAKPIYGVPFLMGLLYEARAELQRVAVGAAQQNINQGVLKSHVVIAPPPALAKAYSVKVAPWFDQRIKLAEQSRTLATLRDTLIPKLLSGELKVKDFTA